MINFNNKLFSTDGREYWITSDLHFFHKGILKFCPDTRPWSTLEEMHEALIEEWNSKVKPDDVVFHLGDFSFSGKEKTEAIIARLNGHIVWILGNHDQKVFNSIKCNKHHYLEVSMDGNKVCMMHYPVASFNRQAYGSLMFFGHCHGNYEGVGRMLDVGYDSMGRILKLEEAVRICLEKDIKTVDHHGNS